MNALRTSSGCLFIALLLNAAFTFAQGLAPGSITGKDAVWLQLNTHNPAKTQGLMPEWTVIITSARPTVKQIRNNRWEISFTP